MRFIWGLFTLACWYLVSLLFGICLCFWFLSVLAFVFSGWLCCLLGVYCLLVVLLLVSCGSCLIACYDAVLSLCRLLCLCLFIACYACWICLGVV